MADGNYNYPLRMVFDYKAIYPDGVKPEPQPPSPFKVAQDAARDWMEYGDTTEQCRWASCYENPGDVKLLVRKDDDKRHFSFFLVRDDQETFLFRLHRDDARSLGYELEEQCWDCNY